MTLGGVLAALRLRWLAVLIIVAAAVAAGAGIALTTPKSYVATATVVLRWVGAGGEVAEPSNTRYLTSRTQTYAMLAEQPAVLQDAIGRAGVDMTVNDLRARIQADAPLGAQLIRVRGWGGDPTKAAALANATAAAVADEVTREEVRGALRAGDIDAVVAVEAQPPNSSATPRISMYIAVAAGIGLSIGILVAIVWAYLSARGQPRPTALASPVLPPTTRHISVAHVGWAMLIAATIPWRSDTFYEGGADPVVLAKAGISLGALALAFWKFRDTRSRHPVPAAPILLVSAYLVVTVIGGMANQDLSPALVVAIRVCILMVTLCFLCAAYGPVYLMRALVHVFAVLIVLSSVSGLTDFSGRLGGVLPPLNPNALAFITAVVCIWLMAKVMAGRDETWEILAIGGCLVVVVLTGSRTGLAAMVIAFVLMSLRMTALRPRTLGLLALGVPGIAYLTLGTDILSSVLLRGGGEQVATLSNRTIAWNAALHLDRDVWQTWFGQGLAQKKISVPGQWWETQLLDSSWISALVQGGNLGVTLVIALGLSVLCYAAFSARSKGSVWLGLAVLTTLGGFLESGLFDGSLQFMVFLVTAMGAYGGHLHTIGVDRRAVTAAAPTTVGQLVPLA